MTSSTALGLTGPIAALALIAVVQTSAAPASESGYSDRPLRLPHIESSTECPVSVGSNAVVSSTHPYIFGAGGYFFGNGPVYVGLAWKPADRAEARFELVDRMPRVSEGYRLKTPWIMDPKYQGAALVRGARIGSVESGRILFQGPEATGPELVLRFQVPGTLVSPAQLEEGAHWGFWPASMVVQGPGCYVLQIDTELGSDFVVFEATDGHEKASLEGQELSLWEMILSVPTTVGLAAGIRNLLNK